MVPLGLSLWVEVVDMFVVQLVMWCLFSWLANSIETVQDSEVEPTLYVEHMFDFVC